MIRMTLWSYTTLTGVARPDLTSRHDTIDG